MARKYIYIDDIGDRILERSNCKVVDDDKWKNALIEAVAKATSLYLSITKLVEDGTLERE